MKRPPLRIWLFGALAVTLVAAALAPAEDAPVVSAVQAPARSATSAATASGSRAVRHSPESVLDIRPRVEDEKLAPTFAATTWAAPRAKAPPKPKSPVEAQPALVQAPPLPYRFLGYYEEDGRPAAFLQQNERMIVARPGEVLGGLYEVEVIENGKITFVYLPLNEKQVLSAGESN